MIAYHFTADKLRDGRPIPPVGEWLVHDGPVVMCVSGLHASVHPMDALKYAPGPMLHLVECDEIVKEDRDKIVCRRRKILKSIDATELTGAMARWSALQMIHLWDAPTVVVRFLETGDDSLRDAALAAMGDNSRWAASAAEYDSMLDAARDAAWNTTRVVVWAGALHRQVRHPALAAARDAAAAIANSTAPRGPAWDAIWVATLDIHKAEFKRRVDEAFEGR